MDSVNDIEYRIKELQGLLKNDKQNKKLKRELRMLKSRLENIRVARQLVKDNPRSLKARRPIRVAEGKPDYANYVSNDEIQPLPKFYR